MNYLSNLPPGCLPSDIPGNGPYERCDDDYTCSECFEEGFNNFEDPPTILNDEPLCPGCRAMCEGCGEWLSDESISVSGPVVRFRDYLHSGKRIAQHASCAVDTFMCYLDQHFSYDHTTKGEIAALIEPHFAQALVWVAYPEAVAVERNGWVYILKRPSLGFRLDFQTNAIAYGRSEREAWIDAAKALPRVAA